MNIAIKKKTLETCLNTNARERLSKQFSENNSLHPTHVSVGYCLSHPC